MHQYQDMQYFWRKYTQELLQWQQGPANVTATAQPAQEVIGPSKQQASATCSANTSPTSYRPLTPAEKDALARSIAMAKRKDATCYILLGARMAYAQHVLQELTQTQSDAHILILESDPQKTLHFQKHIVETWGNMPKNMHILVDSSPWALLSLTLALGLKPETCALLFCTPPQERCRCLNQWRKLFLGSRTAPLSMAQDNASLSVHIIMHPDEPHKEDFFAHIPPWIKEVLVLWDASPDYIPPTFTCATSVRHFCRPLQNDFSAQRNTLLTYNKSTWIFYLDADERLTPETWERLNHLMHPCHGGGVLFVRMTFEGDAQHIRMGHGLWPDVQLRLFPHTANVRFEGSIHEQVSGLTGQPVFAPPLAIWHYSHIHKSSEELQKRLETFNKAGSITHKLSAAYPALSKQFFLEWQQRVDHDMALHLPI